MADLDRYFEPENGDLCMTRKFLEPAAHSYSVTLAGYSVYVSMCIGGTWQHCRFSAAPAHVQDEAFDFMRQGDAYLPRNLPGLFTREARRSNRWATTAVVEDGDILPPDQAATHRTIGRYDEALTAPAPPKPTARMPAMSGP